MKRLLLFLLLALTLPRAAHADEASRHAKAAEIVSLLHLERVMSQMMDDMMKQTSAMSAQLGGHSMTPAETAKVADFQHQVFALVNANLGWKTLEPEYIDLYATTFSDAELDGILAFYKSPVGTALVEKTPQLTKAGSQFVQTRMAAIQPQLQQLIQDFIKGAMPPAGTAPGTPR